jgi:hypothetical protein
MKSIKVMLGLFVLSYGPHTIDDRKRFVYGIVYWFTSKKETKGSLEHPAAKPFSGPPCTDIMEMTRETNAHPNDDTDRNQRRDLVESLRGKIPGAGIRLQEAFKRPLELLLCRQVPSGELAGLVLEILASVTLIIESDGLASPDLLPNLVRRVARQFIPVSAPRVEPDVKKASQPNPVFESILQGLPPNQCEALKMVYVDGTDDEVICGLKGLTIKELSVTKVWVRERFLAISASQRSKAMGQ